MRSTTLMLLPAAIALGMTGLALAQAQGGSPDPKAAQAGTYRIEPSHTQIGFSVLHIGFTRYDGVFSNASGELKLDPNAPAATSVDISVPVDSVQTTSKKLDGELKGAEFIDAGKFPTMRFRSTKVTRTGPGSAVVAGELTLHGVTRPITLNARFIGAGVNPVDKHYTVGFAATGTVKRSEFGVKAYVPLVSDEVQLTINAAFTKQ